MKILLINPPIEILPGEFVAIIAPLGLAYIASYLEQDGHLVKIIDCLGLSWKNPRVIKKGGNIIRRLSPPDKYIRDYLRNFRPDIVGISNLVSPTEGETVKLARKIKKALPETKIVVGGSNASARPLFFIKDKCIDFVIIGEGEETMKELISKFAQKNFRGIKGLYYKDKNKIRVNPPRPFITDLDSLPYPAWHLLPMEEYFHGQPAGIFIKKKRFATVISSRGCPGGCNFCTNEKVWGRLWRPRSVENTIAEIKLLKRLYKIEEIQFVDPNISVRKDRFIKLCKALKKEKLPWLPSGGVAVNTLNPRLIRMMAKSGCYAVQFGIEHGDPDMQRRIGKIVPLKSTKKLSRACKRYGMWTHGNFIMGLPGETRESAVKSLEYAIKADLDSVSFFTALPLPGSKIYHELFESRGINLYNLRFYLSQIKLSEIPIAELNSIIKKSFKEFLLFKLKRELNPIQILKRLSLLRSFDDLLFYARMLSRFIQIETIKSS